MPPILGIAIDPKFRKVDVRCDKSLKVYVAQGKVPDLWGQYRLRGR